MQPISLAVYVTSPDRMENYYSHTYKDLLQKQIQVNEKSLAWGFCPFVIDAE